MTVLERLRAADLRRIVSTYRDALRDHQEELNRLNVYPVPDGDTGTNMALTVESVMGELDGRVDAAMGEVCEAIRHGSLMGARGNSGVILSQILRGLADTFAPLETVAARDVATGLRRAADAAYQSVLRPVEGTILTVVRSAAESVERALEEGESRLAPLLERAAESAREAVARTPDLLPVLREAGVVDAGGRGFELLLDACLAVVAGRAIPAPEVVATPAVVAAYGDAHAAPGPRAALDGPRYEVMFFLDADDGRIPEFKDAWGALGDSIVVVGGDGVWNCHIHADDIGAAIEAGIAVGRPSQIRVTDLVEQVEDLEAPWVRDAAGGGAAPGHDAPAVTTGVVAVAVGKGVEELLRSLGVQHVVPGGQTMNPSTADLLEAVEATRADAVVILPNNRNIVPVARQVPSLADRPVGVVPTGSVVEALSALVGYAPDAALDDNVAAMADAAARVRAGEVTQAVRESTADGRSIAAGDWIAISGEGIVAAEMTAGAAVVALVDALVDDDTELVTVVVGEGAASDDTARLVQHLAETRPEVEVELHQGDQPLYPYLVGAE